MEHISMKIQDTYLTFDT